MMIEAHNAKFSGAVGVRCNFLLGWPLPAPKPADNTHLKNLTTMIPSQIGTEKISALALHPLKPIASKHQLQFNWPHTVNQRPPHFIAEPLIAVHWRHDRP